ncbi:ferric-chelate reductase fre2 [Phialemonium atrogriseum]|uniref:Ferric-chelate reductase fre2 n=1 Tax=Phialemonium atrogriseum TaxID=1093897 RepID=A0AAJ0BYP6_9PEZI|nr:ferric-chelate reductase fre2 [Phialemonium atrogriseum]KAK1766307.1 ferric-chelate reductase fre2 [Phialemonium atrogriseum]
MNPRKLALAGLAAHLVPGVDAGQTLGRPGYGFIGYGIEMYKPTCAYACRDSITAPLNCTDADMGGGHEHSDGMIMKRMDGWMVMAPTPECKVSNDFFLQTLAYCMKKRCPDVAISKLESFWVDNVAGSKPHQPVPKESYSDTLNAIVTPPTRELNNSVPLNYIAVVTDDQWSPIYGTNANFEDTETTHVRYGLVILLTGAIIPIGLSLLRFLPWPASWVSRINGYLIDPPLFGSRHASPVWGLGIMPTRGQALFIAYLWIINVVLSAVGYVIIWPNTWYESTSIEVMAFVANRTGILSFANFPLVFLYSGRNNILLWVTDWSHSTFLLLHRWIAFICTLQAVLHSIIYLYMYTQLPGWGYASESRLPYWVWGIIATLALSIAIPASILPLRQRLYEVFLAGHITLAILSLLGCFLHIWYRFNRQWGYETWLYVAAAVWAFDRTARLTRTVLGGRGIRRAFVTPIDDDYYRVDVPGVAIAGHAYLHFPTLSGWRVWENHPFSVAAITAGRVPAQQQQKQQPSGRPAVEEPSTPGASSRSSDSLPQPAPPTTARASVPTTTFLIRKHAGITSALATAGNGATTAAGIPVLVEGHYGATTGHGDAFPTPDFPHVLCVAGGVGITAVLPVLRRLSCLGGGLGGEVKVFWGVRSGALVGAVEDMLGYACGGDAGGERRWGYVDVVVAVGERLDLRYVLESELRSRPGGTTVVVCGPAGMADEVRCVVSGLSRQSGVLVRLVVESFSW